jgi:site-specific DNA recombinase
MKIIKLNKCIGYLCITSIMNANGYNTVNEQKKVILKWSKKNNVYIEKFYTESDYDGKRPIFNLMLKEIGEGIINPDALVVSSFEKLLHCSANIEFIENGLKNIEVISAYDSLSNSQNTDLLLNIFTGFFNENQITRQSEIIQHGLSKNARNGIFTGGTPPFGYTSKVLETNSIQKILVVNPIEAAIVKELFNLANDDNGVQLTLGAISRALNKQNLFRRGKQWNYKTVSRVIKNPIYYGERLWGKNRASNYNNQLPITIKTPSIISKEQFLSIQKQLQLRISDFRGNHNEN